ncbi:DNA-packaging protein [Kordiimonas marina]|uniref:DNA-packaging protein n=1 Tax=Kordiimonas marina TaxID=2872312 RepID=UPI001FF51C3B|nr:terminase family protein [Kordiimonas marina]
MSLTRAEAATLKYDWNFWAREAQLPPKGSWSHWLILAGRGFGKTRTGAEWVRAQVEAGKAKHIALIAPTLHDGRAVMVEGESGLLNICPPWMRPKFEPTKRTLRWPNGAVATLYSAEEPERLRGPQHDCAWADELCAWRHGDATWNMLMFGLRLGDDPRTVITTTPKPVPVLKKLIADAGVHVTRGSTYDNLDNLAPGFARDIVKAYEGTRLGRQELMAEILEDVPGALWQRDRLESLRVREAPDLTRLVVAVDPPASAGEKADECGLVAAGVAANGRAYVLADDTTRGMTPHGWAARAVALYHKLKADRIVAETNQGGAMVAAIIAQIDATVPVRAVHATRSKAVRAEPVAALYEQGRVHHAGSFPALEDQMCAFTGAPIPGMSPDRVDALVWALTDLMLRPATTPTIRML